MSKLRRMRWVEHVAGMGKMINALKILIGKPEGKRPLGRSRRRWDDIKKNIRDIGLEGVAWLVDTVMKFRGKGGEFLDQLSVLLTSQYEFCSIEVFFF
jgi:hypothetical protein